MPFHSKKTNRKKSMLIIFYFCAKLQYFVLLVWKDSWINLLWWKKEKNAQKKKKQMTSHCKRKKSLVPKVNRLNNLSGYIKFSVHSNVCSSIKIGVFKEIRDFILITIHATNSMRYVIAYSHSNIHRHTHAHVHSHTYRHKYINACLCKQWSAMSDKRAILTSHVAYLIH